MTKGIPVVIVAGPTATGKSDLAIDLATRLKGEIVSADSMQIYKRLDIATAKLPVSARNGIPHHMIDILEANEVFSVQKYITAAKQVINDIHNRGYLPIVCGGTGQYISSLVEGISYDRHPFDEEVRAKLSKEYDKDNGQSLFKLLQQRDPMSAAKLHINDKKRIVRALEMLNKDGLSKEEINSKSKEINPFDFFNIVLLPASREHLYTRINDRVEKMVEDGLLEEAKYVFDNADSFITARQAIGYKELFSYFNGEIDLDEAIDRLKQSSRRYAKNA